MKLSKLISAIELLVFEGNRNQEVAGIAYHSKRVKPGFIFVAIPGLKTDGHHYIEEAINKGAKAIVLEEQRQVPSGISQIVVSDTRITLAKLASVYFDNPTEKLRLIGITGTNGKTTTGKLAESIFLANGMKTGLLGTIEYRIGDENLPVGRTTPESCDLQDIFYRMVQKHVQVAIMEVSSHAVDLHRTDYCQFDALVFTNLSQDHLDYHGTLDKYFEAKNKIFLSNAGEQCAFVINKDDAYGQRIGQIVNTKKISYGLDDGSQVRASEVVLASNKTGFRLDTPKGSVNIDLKLLGLFNVYNALAAASVGLAFDLPLDHIKRGLEAIKNIPGRFEVIDCGQSFSVIIDYAHTPDGLEKLLASVREITKGQLITVFGCGGDRDALKRPVMGEIAGSLSDYSIITSDNPRSEDPEVIISNIENGLRKVSSDYSIETDRRNAIFKGIALAKENDCVVIAGKGHETYQEFKDKTIPFDDRAIAQEALRECAKCSQ